MDGLPKPQSPTLRRAATRCRLDRRSTTFAWRSPSKRATGRRRAKKQLRQCPETLASVNQSESDLAEEDPAHHESFNTSPRTNIESTQPINERLSFTDDFRNKNETSFRIVNKTNHDHQQYQRHSSSYCSNCGDYVSLLLDNSFRSLPNYSLGVLDHPCIDLSPENSSGPISFDSGIEQPYKDTRTSNSSPTASSPFNSASKPSSPKLSIVEYKSWEKPPAIDDRSDKLNSINLISQPVKHTSTAETQTDWIPYRVLVIERDQVVPAKSIFDPPKPVERFDRKVTVLKVWKNSRRNIKEKKSWLKYSSASSTNAEDDQERVYHSDSALDSRLEIIMPVGTSFENSAMKSSFSLSSLQGAAGGGGVGGSPFKAPPNQERPYHSLTKKRKDPNRELWRRSWGSTNSNQSGHSLSSATIAAKDDFWAALQHNYNYIMDNQLIDSCKEANGELSAETTPSTSLTLPKDLPSCNSQWGLGQLIADFTDLCQWLTNMQEEVYSTPENLSNRNLRAARMAELTAHEYRRKRFMEQTAGALARGGAAACAEVTWRARHLALKWDSVLHAMSPEHVSSNHTGSDAEHEMKCLRRWLREMEGRLPPLSLTAAAGWSRLQLNQKVLEHEVLQREVTWHGRIVSSVVRLCRLGPAEAVAGGLERRWHHLYLRALEWQCHLESCLSRIDTESLTKPSQLTDSDDEPVVKHPRLIGPQDDLQILHNYAGNSSSEESFSEDDNDDCNDIGSSFNQISTGSEADTEGSIADDDAIMASLPLCDGILDEHNLEMPVLDEINGGESEVINGHDQVVTEAVLDCVDGLEPENLNASFYEDQPTPVTVVKRPKKVNESKFTSSNRKSKNLAVYYFKHPDTESDTQMISGASGTDDKSQEETSEDEWTYTVCEKDNNTENTDIMTSSLEQIEEIKDSEEKTNTFVRKLDFDDDPTNEAKLDQVKMITEIKSAPENIRRLVNQADEMVQKKAQEMNNISLGLPKTVQKKSKLVRNFKPLNLNDSSKTGFQNQNKMSRIKEWLQQNTPDDLSSESSQQVLDSCDASGEYTTGDSDRQSVTSEELSPSVATYCNVTSSQEHSINAATPTNHSTKVILRGKRNSSQGTRPWSVSCLSQLSYAAKETSASALNTPTTDAMQTDVRPMYGRTSGMSISESALNTLAGTPNIRGHPANDKFQGSSSSVKTTIQANLSSSTTINEGCVNCFENIADKKCSMRRKRLKFRRRHQGIISSELETEELRLAQIAASSRGNRLVKSCSFSGKDSITQKDFKHDRCSSDPSSSRKNRFDTTSTSGNDSEEEIRSRRLPNDLAVSTDQTIHASASEDQTLDGSTDHMSEVTPNFKIGPEGGSVRPRLPLLNMDRERASLLGMEIVERSVLAETPVDRDSDVDRSIQTAGTEEHSSFSEQAWDFYQEKYQSEAYSEAPDSDAARRLLEFGDDYRNFLDSQSDCCSSLSAHPDPSPLMNRRRAAMQNYSPTNTENRKNAINKGSFDSPEYGSFGRRSKKSSTSSFDRKKSLMDSLERSKRSPGTESDRIKRAKKILSDSLERKNTKRSSISDGDNLNDQRRKYTSSNSTSSDLYNSSLEYQYVKQATNGNKPDILDSLSRRTRKASCDSNKSGSDESNSRLQDSSLNSSVESPTRRKRLSIDADAAYDNKHKNSARRRGSGLALLQMSGSERRCAMDSDSDNDDLKNLLQRSQSQLEDAEAVLAKDEATPDLLEITEYRDLLATCAENIRCMETVLAGACEGVLSAAQQREIKGLITKWSTLRTSGESRLTARRLHRELLSLKGALQARGPGGPRPALHSRAQLHHRVEDLRAHLATLQEQKASMLKLNVSVHRLLTDIGINTSSGNCISDTLSHNLKNEVTELYRLWDECFESTNSELTSLETALECWSSWENGLAELKGALRGDCDTVRLIEAALAAGGPTRVAPHVTQLARLLSETTNQKGECCSLSDSGLSDSGCEQELSERERRLMELRSAARAMENVLAPGSKLLKAMTKRMEEAELQLRTLQTACRDLIVRTAGGVATSPDKTNWDIASRLSITSGMGSAAENGALTSPDDPDNDPSDSDNGSGRGRRWAWCTLPIQICLLALLCACLMGGPRCCDAVNNLGAGFTPHLRYTKGPPPV